MNSIKQHPYLVGLVGSITVLSLFLLFTNPASVSIGLLTVPVVLLFFILFSLSQIVLGATHVLSKMPRKQRTVSLVVAGLITIVMILQSAGGLSGIDMVLLALIAMIAALYISKF